jgi:hypothetical protein
MMQESEMHDIQLRQEPVSVRIMCPYVSGWVICALAFDFDLIQHRTNDIGTLPVFRWE